MLAALRRELTIITHKHKHPPRPRHHKSRPSRHRQLSSPPELRKLEQVGQVQPDLLALGYRMGANPVMIFTDHGLGWVATVIRSFAHITVTLPAASEALSA